MGYHILYHFITWIVFVYSLITLSFYLFIGIYSIGATRHHLQKNSFTDHNILASSPSAPSVSVLAPAYNEGLTIIQNVRSLLSIYYNHLEIIVINDGSTDDSMQRLIDTYELAPAVCLYDQHLITRRIKGIYKSRNPVYHKLLVIDKDNGGKSDALNAGINVSEGRYLVCIDVDCILEQDALIRLIKPFQEEGENTVIAAGGVVRIANSCIIENGRLLDINLPGKFLPRVQVLEYIRSFLLGRMAWSRLNGLLIISGAFGAFDRDIVIKAGGYSTRTVGEDMELLVRMRRYMEESKLPYKVTYIPDPLCWTEVPETYKMLGRQRNRWARGTFETLKLHRRMFFNPRYGLLGMISYPYWFFFEFLGPVIEFLGMAIFLLLAIIGMVDWWFFFILLGFIITLGFVFSILAIFMEAFSYNQYKKKGDIRKLILAALLEPLLFHPFIIWSAIRGYVDLLKKKKSWGEMKRKGFTAKADTVQ